MLATALTHLRRLSRRAVAAGRTRVSRWTKPRVPALAGGLLADLARSRSDVLLENALLRQQGIVLKRTAKRSALTPTDWGLLVLLASRLRTWAAALVIVQPETALLFRPLFAFVIVALGSRRVVQVGVTRSPTDAWVTQQLREATPFGARPRYLLCDHESTDGARFLRLAAASGIEVVRTPARAPRATAIVARFLGSVRREGLDHVLILAEHHRWRVLSASAASFNEARPHQGLAQAVPPAPPAAPAPDGEPGAVVAHSVLGGLHHVDRRVA